VGEISPRGNRGFLEQEVLKSLKPSNRDRALMSSEGSRPVLDGFLPGGDPPHVSSGIQRGQHPSGVWERRVHGLLDS